MPADSPPPRADGLLTEKAAAFDAIWSLGAECGGGHNLIVEIFNDGGFEVAVEDWSDARIGGSYPRRVLGAGAGGSTQDDLRAALLRAASGKEAARG